jgi:isoleucyl-tRNA synthetase
LYSFTEQSNKEVFVSSEPTGQESFSFPKMENNIQKFWKENDIFKKTLEQTKDSEPYIFYDGPPFATGLPHHGHLVGSILKDIVPRYFTMKGRYVERRFGWDCHGLPIEHEIDKQLGMSAQDAVQELGIKKYNDECRAIVQRFTSEWEKTISRIGRWVDFENDYKTMDLSFMESVWWVFKQLWDKDLVYQGTRVVPFSTSLGTVLSNFEAGQNYQDVQDPAVTVLFKLEDEDKYIAAWTTTPWTLPSNLGLCVGADIDYVEVHDPELQKTIILAKTRMEHYGKKKEFSILREFKGSELKGAKYDPLFPYFNNFKSKGGFQIFNDGYVTTDNGTGIVHLAPSFGEDDNRVMKDSGFNFELCPINEKGEFLQSVIDFAGQYVKDADKGIIKKLKDDKKLYEQSVLVHSYPMCPRSDTPLIYRSIPSWYVGVEKIKSDLLESNAQINWVPSHIKDGRFGKWLEGARDWSISRNRIWGTPIPIWSNKESGKFIAIGSIEELKKYTGVEVTDLHRENIDSLNFKIDGEVGEYKRITEIFDCWFESGSMPYAQIHYPFENQEAFENGFPAQFIAEGLDQTRGWFYTLTVLSTALFKKPAFKNVIVNGIVNAEDGKKMSKRLRNYTPPDNLMEEYGADALRLYLITSGLVKAEDQRFSDTGVKDMVRRALLPWFNAFKFFNTYAAVDGWSASKNFTASDNITDHWIISNLQTLKLNISNEMESYHLYNVVPQLFKFIEDLTNWYIRLNRNRFWGEGLSQDKCAAYSTLFTTVKELSQVMAPFAPFLSDYIYQELQSYDHSLKESVHLESYPTSNQDLIEPSLEDAMGRIQEVILLGRQKRNQEQIKVKVPLKTLTVIHKDQSLLKEISRLEEYIKNELNVKSVEYSSDESKFIALYAKPNSPLLGKKLGKEFGKFMKLINGLSPEKVAEYEKSGNLEIDNKVFGDGEILIFREPKEGTNTISNRFISIDLDTQLNQSLLDEGLAREVVNRIQKTRKDINLNVDDRVLIQYQADQKISDVIEQFKEKIMAETLCIELKSTTLSDESFHKNDIEQYELRIKVEKK